jgi:gamma-glutamyltranspeptidase
LFIAGYIFDSACLTSTSKQSETWHRIVEAFKFAYGKRSALGDEDFVDIVEVRTDFHVAVALDFMSQTACPKYDGQNDGGVGSLED